MGQFAAAFLLLLSLSTSAALAEESGSFDYIVIGAGTCGLLVANRLSEDPSVKVAVIEPGEDVRDNRAVWDANGFQQAINTSIDWSYFTVQQPGLANQPLQYHQGKAIGGSSTINGMTYIRANEVEVDAWEGLGNPGWNWASLYPYYKKTERFTTPTAAQQAAGISYNPESHGFSGDVRTGYQYQNSNGTEAHTVLEAWARLSVPHNPDSTGGDVHGVSRNPSTIDRDLDMRWDAARAFYYPIEDRPNLKVFNGSARRITWAEGVPLKRSCGGVTAGGVEYVTPEGQLAVISASKEVIVSAGALRSPLVLEGSGVGNPSILEALGIEIIVDLPGVGENFQEQPNTPLLYTGPPRNSTGYSVSQAFVTPAELFGSASAASAISASIVSSIPSWADKIVAASGGPAVLNKTAVEAQLRIQHDLMFNTNTTVAEILTITIEGGLYFSNYWFLYPFSRGSVHLSSSGVADVDRPRIDPRFNLVDFDLAAQVATAQLADRFWRTEPVSRLVTERSIPTKADVPDDATDEQWATFVRANTVGNSHPIGSAAMMSRDLGGVVDPELRVYGTRNVRVVDASIFPLQWSGHPTATLYAVAERAAEIIKNSPLYAA